jgi:ataxia telangiectasia mutated family protein
VGDRNAIGEVVVCIQLLTASSNAPIHASAENIIRGLADFVKSASVMAGNAQQLAFNSINTVISKVLFDQCELARSSLLGLVPVIRQLWATTKHHGLKDELLVNVMLCIVALRDLVQKEPSDQLARSIEGLAETLYSEYVRRSEKDVLQLDESILYPRETPQVQQIYGPCLGNSRSEHNWTVVWAIAQLLKLSKAVTAHLSVGDSASEAPVKRQRINSGIEDVFRDSVSATGSRRICALQLTPFLEAEIDLETKESFLQRLVVNILDGNGAISSWTMVALERYVCRFLKVYVPI